MRLTTLLVTAALSVIVTMVQAENRDSVICTTAELKSYDHHSYTQPAKVSGSNRQLIHREGPIRFLLGRPVNISGSNQYQWVAAIIETALEYKLAAVKKIRFIKRNNIRSIIPAHGDYSLIPDNAEYLIAGKKLNADYIATQKFEVTRGKMMVFYMEIISSSTQEVLTTIERTFKLHTLGSELDVIVGNILTELSITPPRELTRFLRLPAIGTNIRDIKTLGNYIIKERFSRFVDSIPLANKYRTLCENEHNMQLAYYRAGFFFFALGRYSDAAEALTLLFRSIPEYTPIYLPLARALRLAKRYRYAVRIVDLGEKRGIATLNLYAEKALSYQAMGKIQEAEHIYRKILKYRPNDRNALQFYARYYEQ